jgi:AcrR family transcriptional regulator
MSSSIPPDNVPELTPLIDLLPLRRRRRRSRGEVALNREQIARAAIELADAEGSEAISMRRIASKLGAGTMTLYGYVSDRDALLAYMLDEVASEIQVPGPPSGDWRADLELLARQIRSLCQRHSWIPPLLGTSPYLLAPRLLPPTEFCLTALEAVGMDVRQAVEVLRLLNNYVVGATLREVTESRTASQDDGTYKAATAAYFQQVMSSGRYPAVSRLSRFVLDGGYPLDPDESFDLGLRCLLDGVAAQLTGSSRGQAGG